MGNLRRPNSLRRSVIYHFHHSYLIRVCMSYIILDCMQGLGSLYIDTVHFRDRHTGCNVFEANALSLMLLLLSFVNCHPKTCLELHLLLKIDQTRYSKRHVLCAASFAEHKATQSHKGRESTREKRSKQPFVCPTRLFLEGSI